MEDNAKVMEALFERAVEYSKTSYEVIKLKALDKTADAVSSFLPYSVVIVFMASFMFFFNLGLALWLGEILGKIYWGFLVIAGFYGIAGILIHYFMHKWLKKRVCDYFIKQALK